MKDKLGREFEVGQSVVFGEGGSMTLLLGKILKISPKTVTIACEKPALVWRNGAYHTEGTYTEEYRRTPDNVVIL